MFFFFKFLAEAQGIFYVTLLLIASVGFVLSLTCCALAPNCQTALNYFSPSLMFSTTYAGVNMFIPDFPRWEVRLYYLYSGYM